MTRTPASAFSRSSIARPSAWSGWSRTCCGWRVSRRDRKPSTSRRATSTALVRGIVADFEPTATAKQQTLAFTVSPDAARLETDAAKLHDIIRNLVENAVNYTPEGGAIDITASVAAGRFQLSVADTGHGIAPDDLGRVFERFYRVDKSRTRPGGTGLGLSIVKHLVQVLEGEVIVENQTAGGALFTINLPFR